MVCHYCGHTEPVPAKCPHCRVTEPVPMGFGTEKVEEEIARVFPEARVARLDRDSVTSERAFRQIVEAFARGDDDILVGTQMITKDSISAAWSWSVCSTPTICSTIPISVRRSVHSNC